MNYRVTLTVIAVSVLSACATTQGYEEKVQAWLGTDVTSVIEAWGEPSAQYNMHDGTWRYVWDQHDRSLSSVSIGGIQALSAARTCRTTLEVGASGRVIGYDFAGEACKD